MNVLLLTPLSVFSIKQGLQNANFVPPFENSDDSSITVTAVDNEFHRSVVSNCFGVGDVEKALHVQILSYELRMCADDRLGVLRL
jgi:hypothetical protein